MSTTGPLCVGLSGAGLIARDHLAAFQALEDRVRLTAIYDVDVERARYLASLYSPEITVYESYAEMVNSDEIDAVDLCTPHDIHTAQSIAAAESGKHILVEKPMACSVEDAHAMVEAADKSGVVLMVGQVLRYVPSNIEVRRRIESGEMGQIWWGRADNWLPYTIAGREPLGGGDWMRDGRRAGGGALALLGTHHIDLFRYFLGEVETVSARTWTGHPLYTNGAEDRAVATLTFANGASIDLCTSYVNHAPHFAQFMLFGDRGSIYTELPDNSDRFETAAVQHRATAAIWTATDEGQQYQGFTAVESDDTPVSNPFINEIRHFCECVRNGAEPLSSGRDNLGTMQALYGCYESARRGVDIDLYELYGTGRSRY
ncbi:Gfo/Idh/MocA family protein [Nocardia sp. SC052]|uniref:Gfo/Idh/MocA family protein n=1 Tax=Nocardia sichangensis TaxID=3385975 RepID=UPI0039A3D8EF